MFSLFNVYARVLASRKELDKALYWSLCKDAKILSAAGMYCQALEQPDCLSAQQLEAFLHLGEKEEFLDVVRKHPDSLGQKNLWGMLANWMPDLVLARKDAPPAARAWSYLQQEGKPAENFLPQDFFFQWKLALIQKNYDLASRYIEDIYRSFRLESPQMKWTKDVVTCAVNKEIARNDGGPFVSIIMTAYNEENYIAMALDSILAQSHGNFELIVVDDASTDGTAEIIRRKASEDSRIKVITLAVNSGTWEGKNVALKEAQGDFVMMHDADDWSHPERLRIMLEPLCQGKGLASSSNMIRIRSDTGEPFSRNINNFIRWNPSSFLFRRSFAESCGGYLNILGSDCEFVARHELFFGVSSHVRLKLPLSLAFTKPASLSLKYRGKKGGEKRIREWEYWRFMHVDYLRKNKSLLWKS